MDFGTFQDPTFMRGGGWDTCRATNCWCQSSSTKLVWNIFSWNLLPVRTPSLRSNQLQEALVSTDHRLVFQWCSIHLMEKSLVMKCLDPRTSANQSKDLSFGTMVAQTKHVGLTDWPFPSSLFLKPKGGLPLAGTKGLATITRYHKWLVEDEFKVLPGLELSMIWPSRAKHWNLL